MIADFRLPIADCGRGHGVMALRRNGVAELSIAGYRFSIGFRPFTVYHLPFTAGGGQ